MMAGGRPRSPRSSACSCGLSIEQRIDGAEKVGDHKTSMLQDVEAGRPLGDRSARRVVRRARPAHRDADAGDRDDLRARVAAQLAPQRGSTMTVMTTLTRHFVDAGGLRVDRVLFDFVERRGAAGYGRRRPSSSGTGSPRSSATLAPRHRELLAERDRLQQSIDDWHRERRGAAHDAAALPRVPRGDRLHRAGRRAVRASTPTGVDAEIAESPGRNSWCRSRTLGTR